MKIFYANPESVTLLSPGETRRVCVIGLGYIGLPTAAVLAQRGHEVIGVDVRPDVVDTINDGRIHIHEPHLAELVESVVRSGRLKASLQAVKADVFFLCVPTPHHADHSPDLTYVEAAAKSIQPFVRQGNLIVLESTSPPGTTERVVIPHAVPEDWTVGEDVFVAHCPERVLPGRILIEVVENDRIVGGFTPECTREAINFYRTFVTGEILSTNAVTAETAKLVENSFRDVNIAFANELSMLCPTLGCDVHEVIALANRHPRVKILNPGPGVGGHCISVDPWFLVHASPNETPLIRTAREVNNRKPHRVLEQIITAAESRGAKTIGCLGLAYKPDVDDLRESPSLEIVRELRQRGSWNVLTCEPYVSADRFAEFPLSSLETVLANSDVVALLTPHRPFLELRAEQLNGKSLIDPNGCWRKMTAAADAAVALRRAA